MQARSLPARHGALWLLAGFRLFRRNPPLLTAVTLGYLFLIIIINLLPFVGPFLLPLALPALAVLVANGCRAIEDGRTASGWALTRGIKENRIPLIRLGGLHLLGSILILSVSTLIAGGPESLAKLDPADEEAMLATMLRLLVVATPVLMAFWFAPLLTAWDQVSPLKSVFFSFVASLRNWRAFAVYVLAVAVVGVAVPGLLMVVVGAISESLLKVLSVALRMVLIFVLAPVLAASVYVSYRDVFHSAAEAAPEPAADEA